MQFSDHHGMDEIFHEAETKNLKIKIKNQSENIHNIINNQQQMLYLRHDSIIFLSHKSDGSKWTTTNYHCSNNNILF